MKEKEPESSWNYQLSVKLGRNGQHLLNIRAEGWDAFKAALKNITEDADNEEGSAVQDTIIALEPEPDDVPFPIADVRARPPEPTQITLPPALAEMANGGNVKPKDPSEIGPITVQSMSKKSGMKGDRQWNLFTVAFSGNIKASTFDAMYAEIAENLMGKQAYVKIEKGKFSDYNLMGIRPAA